MFVKSVLEERSTGRRDITCGKCGTTTRVEPRKHFDICPKCWTRPQFRASLFTLVDSLESHN